MRIVSGHIDNFGKLNDFDFEFLPGLNIINQVNGWGKTTFAAFLKAMFFGMEYSRSKKTSTDRAKYYPWNEGKFGGSLVFEYQGKTYRVVRSFGKKENEDTFVMYDLATNMEVSHLGENFGEEIFKVDRDSFEKTAFITLNEFDLLSDIISGKLGDIDEQEVDMEVSSKALATLERDIKRLDPQRSAGPGTIREKREQLQGLKIELNESILAQQELGNLQYKIDTAKTQREDMTKLIMATDEEQIKLSFVSKQRMLFSLRQSFDDAVQKYQEIHQFFKGQMPSEEEVKDLEIKVEDYNKALHNAKELGLSPEEIKEHAALTNTFQSRIPTKEEFELHSNNIVEIAVMESQISQTGLQGDALARYKILKEKYKALIEQQIDVDDVITDYMGAAELDKRAKLYKDESKKVNDRPIAKKRNYIPHLILSILIIGGGFGLSFLLEEFMIGFGLLVVGVILLSYSFMKIIKQRNIPTVYEVLGIHNHEDMNMQHEVAVKSRDELQAKYLQVLAILNINTDDIMNTLLGIKTEMQEYKHLKAAVDQAEESNKGFIEQLDVKQFQVDRFLGEYIDITEVISRKTAIEGLMIVVQKYQALNEKHMRCKDLIEYCSKLEELARVKFTRYFTEMPETYSEALELVKFNIAMMKERHQDVAKYKMKYDEFAMENDVELLISLEVNLDDSQENMDRLRTQKAHYTAERDNLNDVISKTEIEMEGYTQKVDQLMDIEASIDKVSEDIVAMEAEADIMKLAKECLLYAKESLAEKYMGNITESFEKYRDIIESVVEEKYHIDIGLNVKIEHDGLLHSSEVLSAGKSDLMQICMRLALVDAVYKDVEIPPLILDDPFVNLDDTKLKNATKLLERLGLEQQLVYFVCHTSRSI